MMSQVNLLSADTSTPGQVGGERVQQCWQFEHPRRDLILDATGESTRQIYRYATHHAPLPPCTHSPPGAPLTNSHNTRSATLVFTIPHSAPCHGLAGYFEAHLYGNVGLSTHPDNAHRVSPEMFSWFPLFFPFRQPLYLPSGAQIEVNVWRLSDARGRKVWYEWSAEAFLVVPAGTGAGGAGAGGGGSVPNSASVSTRDGMLSADAQGQGAPLKSPLVDATFSPARAGFADAPGPGPGPVGAHGSGQAWTRVKIGQTGLHNPGGVHSWVGL
jgi:protein arginine N-methyltransferase 5